MASIASDPESRSMNWRIQITGIVKPAAVCLLLLVLPVHGGHNRLLPCPQSIAYGDGKFPLKNITISIEPSHSDEDSFAAAELASALADSGASIPVVNGKTAAPGIVLHRTGAPDPLPGSDDRTGSDSRESYEIRIRPDGAEIRAKSSAGLFYAVQTVRQLVEVSAANRFLP